MGAVEEPSHHGTPGAGGPWRRRLQRAFHGRPLPLVGVDGTMTPAAALWMGSRLWARAFCDAGLEPGDRLVLALPPSAAFVEVLLASLQEGLTLAPVPPDTDVASLVDELDARAAVTPAVAAPEAWAADAAGWAGSRGHGLRSARGARTPDTRFLLGARADGSAAGFTAVTDRELLAALDGGRRWWPEPGGRTVSVLPWHRGPGLVLDLLSPLLARAEIHRSETATRDPAALVEFLDEERATHLAVPLPLLRSLQEGPRGRTAIRRLRSGLVVGAPPGLAGAVPAYARLHGVAGEVCPIGRPRSEQRPGKRATG